MSPLSTALGLLLVLVLPAAALYRRTQPRTTVSWPVLRRGLVLQWAVTLAVIGLLTVSPMDGTDSSGDILGAFGGPGDDPVMDTMVAFILVGVFGIGATLGARIYSGVPVDSVTRTLVGLSIPRKLAVALTAGVAEELVLRGFLITQLEALGVGTVVAGVVALVLGVLTHAAHRSGDRLVLGIPLQAAFVLAFVVTGNVLACVVAHVSYDALVLLTTSPDDLSGRASAR